MRTLRACLATVAVLVLVHPVTAQTSPDVQQGMALVETHCAECHAIDKSGASPLPSAPPFRDLHERYPVEHLERGLR